MTFSLEDIFFVFAVIFVICMYILASKSCLKNSSQGWKQKGYWFGGPGPHSWLPIRWQGHVTFFVLLALMITGCTYLPRLSVLFLLSFAVIMFFVTKIRTRV